MIRVKILILLTVLLNLFALFLFEVPNELSLVNRKTDNKLNESLNGSNRYEAILEHSKKDYLCIDSVKLVH